MLEKRNNSSNTGANGREDYSGKIIRHRFQKFYRILLVLICLIVVGIVGWTSHQNKIYLETEVIQEYPRESSTDAHTVRMGEGILSYSNDGASYMDAKGQVTWNQTFEMQSPIASVCGNSVAIGDYNGRQVFMMNEEGEVGKVNTNLPIKALSASEAGYVAVALDDGTVTWINLYDSEGSEVVNMKTTMTQSGYPVSMNLSANSKLLAVSYLAPREGVLKSSIAFYNFGEVGQNEIDNYMSGYDYQSICPYVQFMSDRLAFALADDRLMFYEGAQKPVSKSETLLESEVQAVYHNENYVALITYDTTGKASHVLHLYDSDGIEKLTYPFDLAYKGIELKKDLIYLYSDLECIIISSNGTEKYHGVMDRTISQILPGNRVDRLTVVGPDYLEELQLK